MREFTAMNISKLYQRAHALRMADKRAGTEKAPPELYVGRALIEQESAVDVSDVMKHLVRTYGTKPLLLQAIADGMEA